MENYGVIDNPHLTAVTVCKTLADFDNKTFDKKTGSIVYIEPTQIGLAGKLYIWDLEKRILTRLAITAQPDEFGDHEQPWLS